MDCMARNLPPLFHADRWEATQGFITVRIDFTCGSCHKLNFKNKPIEVSVRTMNITVAGSQCNWCGNLNAFRYSPTRYLALY